MPLTALKFPFAQAHEMPATHALLRVGGYRYNFYLDTRTGSVVNRRVFNDVLARTRRNPAL